jgi:hypothetical protein
MPKTAPHRSSMVAGRSTRFGPEPASRSVAARPPARLPTCPVAPPAKSSGIDEAKVRASPSMRSTLPTPFPSFSSSGLPVDKPVENLCIP